MTVDGINGKPMTFKAELTVGPDGIDVEYYDGAAGTVALGLNVPMCYTDAYTALRHQVHRGAARCRTTTPRSPRSASRRPRAASSTPSIPRRSRRAATIGQMLPDVMFGCLIQALPDGVPAEGTSCLWNLRLMGGLGRVELAPEQMKTATPYNVMSFHSGGTGARPKLDGLSATAFPSGVRNVPVEITETLAPLVIWRRNTARIRAAPASIAAASAR